MAGRLFGQSARKSRGSKTRSRSWQPFDQMESRVLLSAALTGNWSVNSSDRAGSFAIPDGSNVITRGGWNTFNNHLTIQAGVGDVTNVANLSLSNNTGAAVPYINWRAIPTPAADVLAINDLGFANGSFTSIGAMSFATLNTTTYTSQDLVGTWTLNAELFRATITINGAGAISGTLVNNNGSTTSVGGSAFIRSTGTGTISLSTGQTLIFTLNNSKDTLTANSQDFGTNVVVSDFTIGVRNTGTNFNRDTIRGNWLFDGNGFTGNLTFGSDTNPNAITGSVITNINGKLGVAVVTGAYLVNPDGSMAMDVNFSTGVHQTFAGRISAGQGTISLDSPSGASNLAVLITTPNRPARNGAVAVSGNLSLYGLDKTGSLTLDGAGKVTAGSYVQGSTLQVVAPGAGSVYNITPGAVNLTVTTQANGTGAAVVNNMVGGVNSRGDLLDLNEFNSTSTLTQATNLDLLVTHNGTYTAANLSGVWNIDAQNLRGSVAFNKNGVVTGGSITLNDGETLALGGGRAVIDSTGVGTLNLNTTSASISLSITVASGKDIIIGNSPTGGNLAILVKSTGTYAASEVANTTWHWSGVGSSGTLNLRGNSAVHGKIIMATGQIVNIGGSYKMLPDGSISMTITYSNGTTQTLIGRVNGSRNTINLNTTGGTAPSQHSQLVVLVADANHAPLANASGTVTVTAHAKSPVQITYQQILAATGTIDHDGDTVYFVLKSIGPGAKLSLLSGGVTSSVFPGFTTIAPGDSIIYTAPGGASGQTLAFSVVANDGVLSAANASQVFAVVNPIPVVGVTPSRPTVDEAQVGTANATSAIVISRNGAPTTEAVTVHLAISGTATMGTQYVLKAPNGSTITTASPTVTIPKGAASVALTVTAISDHLVDPTRTVVVRVVADPNTNSPSYRVASNGSTTVSILDGAPAVTVNATQNTARPGQDGQFVITRSNTSDGAFTVRFNTTTTISGIRAVQGTDYVLKDAAGHTLTDSITFAAGQKTFSVFVVPLNTGRAGLTLNATLAITQSNSYHTSVPSAAVVAIVLPDVVAV